MLKKIMIMVAIIMFGMVSAASAIVMDFETLESPGTGTTRFTHFEEDGFQLDTAVGFASWQTENGYYKGNAAFLNYYTYDAKLSAMNDSLFTLNSIDLNYLFNSASSISFRAYDDNNQLIGTDNITLNVNQWITYNFSSSFENISYMLWKNPNPHHTFDNITINETDSPAPVPEPATCLLLGCGLVGMATINRKRLLNN